MNGLYFSQIYKKNQFLIVLYNSFFRFRVSVLIFILLLGSACLQAQDPYKKIFLNNPADSLHKHKSYEFYSTGFLDNFESFSKFAEGYTLFGYFAAGKAHFRLTDNLEIIGGLHFTKFFGAPGFCRPVPIYAFFWKTGEHFTVKFGNISAAAAYGVSDLLSHSELFFSENYMNGMKTEYRKGKFRNISRIHWERYIFQDSPFPEEFTIDGVSRLRLSEENKGGDFLLRLEYAIKHIGGQIDSSALPTETFFNALAGADFRYGSQKKYLKLFAAYSPSIYSAPSKKPLYTNGHGFRAGAEAGFQRLSLGIKQWYSRKWVSGAGNPIYSNASRHIEGYGQERRSILTVYGNRHFFISENIHGYLTGEAFYDFYNHLFSFKTGFYMSIRLYGSLPFPKKQRR